MIDKELVSEGRRTCSLGKSRLDLYQINCTSTLPRGKALEVRSHRPGRSTWRLLHWLQRQPLSKNSMTEAEAEARSLPRALEQGSLNRGT